MIDLDRAAYAARFGPTAGDRIRLGDTDLWVRVEADHALPGDEAVWGYAKNLRVGMAQRPDPSPSELDVVVCGAVVVDPVLGVVKTDLGIKDGVIVGHGRAGNPAVTDGVELTIGPGTLPVMGHGLIATPGGVDSHVHLLTPALVPVALSAGITTLVTAGFDEPAWAMHHLLRAMDPWPVNLGVQVCARSPDPAALEPLVAAGAVGWKVHEDFGASPAVIDAALRSAEDHDVAVCLHTDGLHETAELDDTLAAVAGRTVHAYHVEGAGGGHPDLLRLAGHAHVMCSSTTPTLPFTRSALDEHLGMILAVHGGHPHVAEDVALALERIRPGTMAAEGPLHELGAIQVVNSDSQGMGRIGETIRRTWQLAHVMKAWRSTSDGQGWDALAAAPEADDNERVRRYLAKYTIEPARVHGIGHEVGSLQAGRLADIVLWRPAAFGAKPELVLKSGWFAWGAYGAGNAAVRQAQPVRYAAHLGGSGSVAAALSTTFVSRAAAEADALRGVTIRRVRPVEGTRGLTRADLVANRGVVPVTVDADGTVRHGDRALTVPAAGRVPLNRLHRLS